MKRETLKPTRTLDADARFFFDWAGQVHTPPETPAEGTTRNAELLARAEAWARKHGYLFEWAHDPGRDSSEVSDERPAWPLWLLMMRDPQGRVCQALGGVDFGTGDPWGNPYRRVCEAEMACEVAP